MCDGFHRSEDDFRFGKPPAFTFQELSHGLIVKHENRVIEELGGQVEVAGFPCDKRGVRSGFKWNLIDGFRELAHEVVGAILVENDAAIDEAGFEIKAKLRAIFRMEPPAAFQKQPTLNRQNDLAFRRKRGCFREHALNEVHWLEMNGICARIFAAMSRCHA